MPLMEVDVPQPLRTAGVTRRELEIFWLVADRLHNREIAERLHLSERTVESHVSSLLGKMGVPSRQGLVDAGTRLREGARHAIPRALSSFVGRAEELEDLRRLSTAHRLVTLVGPAGAGKTRLALRLGEVGSSLPPGTFVDLAAAIPGTKVDRLFADALGIIGSEGTLRDTLRDVLTSGRHWLIVDNCEHVARPTASLLAELLGSTDDLSVLATSQEPLRVMGEVVYQVAPLPLPAVGDVPDEVLRSAAGRLFADRAAAASPGFVVTADNAYDVAELCRRLDGLPLAIELAAARTRVFSSAELLARLDDRFALLTGGGQGPGSRHVSLEQALRWSYDLLADDEKILFERCSVFPGAFDYDAVAGVLAYSPLGRSDIARLFPRLLDRSLLVATRSGNVTEYRMLDSIRQFAASRLIAGDEQERALEEHARYHLRRAPVLLSDLQGGDQRGALSWFNRRWIDMRAAMSWALDRRDRDAAWDFLAGVGTGWDIVGMRGELFEWLDALLEHPLPTGSLGTRAGLTAAMLLWYQSPARGAQFAHHALQAVDGDPRDLAVARVLAGWLMPSLEADGATAAGSSPAGVAAAATAMVVAAADELHRLGDAWHAAMALRLLADLVEDLDSALEYGWQAAQQYGLLGDLVSRANCLHIMGARCLGAGVRLDAAASWLEEARQLADRAGSRHEWLHAEVFSALLDQRMRDAAASRPRFEALVPEFRRIGDRRCLGRSLLGLGRAIEADGDDEVARATLSDCARIAIAVGHGTTLVAATRSLAGIHYRAGRARHAAVLLGASEAVGTLLDVGHLPSWPPTEDLRAALTTDLGALDMTAALAEGRRTPIEEIIPMDPRS